MRQKFKKLPYAALQQQLSKLRSNGIAGEFPMLDAMISQAQDQMTVMYATLENLAAYHDRDASRQLQRTGSYSAFDEPNAVKTCRELLQRL